jgi:hypothetical protein
MNNAVNVLAGSIAGKDSLEACTTEELKALVAKYPYLAAAQLLLCKKVKETAPFVYEKHMQKAGLHVPNQLWLQSLLADKKEDATSKIVTEYPTTLEIETITEEEQIEVAPEIDEAAEEVLESNEDTADTEVMAVPSEDVLPDQSIEEVSEDITPLSADKTEADESEPVLKIPQLKIEPVDLSKSLLSFEPYHTVDYFASQGIKMKEEEKPKDRFSQQLKSFTEWIKTMKRIPPAEIAAQQGNAQEEKKVEQMAAHSLSDQKVVTEAMAEVWEKQGNMEKAIEVYNKLSLLDPSKNAYFAAKIDQLKKLS